MTEQELTFRKVLVQIQKGDEIELGFKEEELGWYKVTLVRTVGEMTRVALQSKNSRNKQPPNHLEFMAELETESSEFQVKGWKKKI